MKRFAKYLLVLCLVFSLVIFVTACNNDKDDDYKHISKVISISIIGDSEVELDDFNLSNYKVKVHFNDGTSSEIELKESYFSSEDLSKLSLKGNHSISVTYDGVSCIWNITLNVTPIVYSITYNLNGGTNNESNKASYTSEDADITLYSPTKEGYTFDGWYSDEEYKNKLEKIAAGTNTNITLYAKWMAANYEIAYELDGGSNNEFNPNTYTIESEITFSDPTKDGYTFDGWYLDDTYQNEIEGIDKGTTGNITIYAKWEMVVAFPFSLNDGIITGYSGSDSDLIIPSEYNDETIVKIGSEVFMDNTTIVSVSIPTSIVEIGEDAFIGCSSIVNVIINSEEIASSIFSFDDAGALIKNASNIYILSTIETVSEYFTKLYDKGESDKTGYNLYKKRANKIILVGSILEEYIDGDALTSAAGGNKNTGNGTKAGIYLNGDKCDEYSACLNGRYFVEVVEGDDVTCYIYHQGCRYFCVYEYHVSSDEENQTNDFEFELFLIEGTLYEAGIEGTFHMYINPNDSENPNNEVRLGESKGKFSEYIVGGSTLILRVEDEEEVDYEYSFKNIDQPVVGYVIDYVPDGFEEAMSLKEITISGKITILNENFYDYENVIVKETNCSYYEPQYSEYNYTFVDSEGNYSLKVSSGSDIYVYYMYEAYISRQMSCLIAENITENTQLNKELMIVDYTILVDSFYNSFDVIANYSQNYCVSSMTISEANVEFYTKQKGAILTIVGDQIKLDSCDDYDYLYSQTGGKNSFAILDGVFSYEIDLTGYRQILVNVSCGSYRDQFLFTIASEDEYIDIECQFTDNEDDLLTYRLQLDENLKYFVEIPMNTYLISLELNGVTIGLNTLLVSTLNGAYSQIKPMYKLTTSFGDWRELDSLSLIGNENIKYLIKIIDLDPIEIDLSKEGNLVARFIDENHYFVSMSTTLGGVDATVNSQYQINGQPIPDSIWTTRQIIIDINNTVFVVPSTTAMSCTLNGDTKNIVVESNGELVFEYETENMFTGQVTYNGDPVLCFIDGDLGRFTTNIDGTFAVPYKDVDDVLKFSLILNTSDSSLYKSVNPINDGNLIAFTGTTKIVYGQFDLSNDIAGIKFKGINSLNGKYSIIHENDKSICYTRGEDENESYIPVEFNDTYLVNFDIVAIQITVKGKENEKAVPLHINSGERTICHSSYVDYDNYNYKTSIIKGETIYGVSSSLSSSGTWYSTNAITVNESGTYEFSFEKVTKNIEIQYKGEKIDNYCIFVSNMDIMIMTIHGSFTFDMYVGTIISYIIGNEKMDVVIDNTDDGIVLNVLDIENMFVTVKGQITVNGAGCSMLLYDPYVDLMSLTNPDGTFSTIVMKNSVLLTATYYDAMALGLGTYNIVIEENNVVLDKPYNIDITDIVFVSGRLINNKDGMIMLYTSTGWFNYFCGNSYKIAIPTGSSLYMMEGNDFTGKMYKNIISYENITEDMTDCDFDCTYVD